MHEHVVASKFYETLENATVELFLSKLFLRQSFKYLYILSVMLVYIFNQIISLVNMFMLNTTRFWYNENYIRTIVTFYTKERKRWVLILILSSVTKKARTIYSRYKRHIYVQTCRIFPLIFSDVWYFFLWYDFFTINLSETYVKEETTFARTCKIYLPRYFYYLRLLDQSDFHKRFHKQQQVPILYLHDSIKRYII